MVTGDRPEKPIDLLPTLVEDRTNTLVRSLAHHIYKLHENIC